MAASLTTGARPAHSWAMPGDYPVVLRAYNDSQPQGVCATQMVRVVSQPVHYVAATGTSPFANAA